VGETEEIAKASALELDKQNAKIMKFDSKFQEMEKTNLRIGKQLRAFNSRYAKDPIFCCLCLIILILIICIIVAVSLPKAK
jgi:hypothetical protein